MRQRGVLVGTVVVGLLAAALAGCRHAGGGSQGSAGSAVGGTSGGSTTGGSTGGGTHALASQLFTTIDQGDGSLVQAPMDVLVTTQSDWSTLWAQHAGPAATPPAVAFPGTAVVGTFQGAQPKPGFASDFIRVDRDTVTGDLVALVRERAAGSWEPAGAAVSPFDVVSTPAPPPGAQLFVHREQDLDFTAIDAGASTLYGQGNPGFSGALLVLHTQADFAAFWPQHSTAAVPVVDFSTDMVVAIFAGAQGFGTTVTTSRIVHDPAANENRIIYAVNPYRGGAPPPPVVESPYQILKVTAGAGPIRAEASASLATSVRASGPTAAYAGPMKAIVARDAATFGTLVSTLLPAGAAPVVDFTKEQAILVFAPGVALRDVSVAQWEKGEITITVAFEAGAGPQYEVVAAPLTCGPWEVGFDNVTPVP
jgi:hypothetical protein